MMNNKNLLTFHSVLSPMTVDCGGGLATRRDEVGALYDRLRYDVHGRMRYVN